SFFDVCPANRQSIGECLVGLCPAGSKCINNHCCIPTNTRKFTTHKRRRQPIIDANLIVDIEKIRQKKGGPCFVRGNEPIGVCLGEEVCPVGYTCENDSCCNIDEGRRLRSRKKKQPVSEEEELTEEEEEVLKRQRGRKEEEEEEETLKNLTNIQRIDEDQSEEEEEEEDEEEERSEERKHSGEDEDERVVEEDDEEPEVEDLDMIRANRFGFRRYKAKRKPKKFTEEIPEAEEIEDRMDEKPAVIETKNICPIGFPIGECVSRLCPDGYSCYKNSCCVITPEINCEDSLPKCHSYLCDIDGYSDFMTQFCAKTCAKCTRSKSAHRQSLKKAVITSTITPVYGPWGKSSGGKGREGQESGIRPELCTDRRSDCSEWANSGFCTSTIYSTGQKMRFCGHSCGYC
ncbi:hypothetical protein PENTCL1PPCAC_30728, partial [Pristionchus entomophagus]